MKTFQTTVFLCFLLSCKSRQQPDAVSGSYTAKKNLLQAAGASGMQQKAAMVDAVFHHTRCDAVPAAADGSAAMPWQAYTVSGDTLFLDFMRSLSSLRSRYACLSKGTCRIVDGANPHILAYTAEHQQEKLLVVLNFDEDNHALDAGYAYMDMPLLLGNYDDGAMPVLTSSLLLRPWELRVYQVQ